MSKVFKYALLIFGIVTIIVIWYIGFGLYFMEIEDHYGDLQELYFKSKNGDVILNRTTSEFGIVEKNWKRINIKTPKKDSTDLYNWVYRNGIATKVEIFRAKIGETELYEITYLELKERIKNSEFIIKN